MRRSHLLYRPQHILPQPDFPIISPVLESITIDSPEPEQPSGCKVKVFVITQ